MRINKRKITQNATDLVAINRVAMPKDNLRPRRNGALAAQSLKKKWIPSHRQASYRGYRLLEEQTCRNISSALIAPIRHELTSAKYWRRVARTASMRCWINCSELSKSRKTVLSIRSNYKKKRKIYITFRPAKDLALWRTSPWNNSMPVLDSGRQR